MSTTKIQFDVSTIERIRHYSSQKPLDAAILTVKVTYPQFRITFYFGLFSRLKTAVAGARVTSFCTTTICTFGRMKKTWIIHYKWLPRPMPSSIQIKTISGFYLFFSRFKWLTLDYVISGLLFEVNLADCLCNVEYSSRKKHTFKITTKEKCDLFFACGSGDELMKWSKCISAISQSNLNVDLIKQLTDESKFNKKRVSLHHAQKSPNVHRVRKVSTPCLVAYIIRNTCRTGPLLASSSNYAPCSMTYRWSSCFAVQSSRIGSKSTGRGFTGGMAINQLWTNLKRNLTRMSNSLPRIPTVNWCAVSRTS